MADRVGIALLADILSISFHFLRISLFFRFPEEPPSYGGNRDYLCGQKFLRGKIEKE